MRHHYRQGCIAVLTMCLGAWQAASADLRVRVLESVNDAEPAAVTHWFGPDRTMRDDGSRYIITRLDRGVTYIVDRENERYSSVPLELQNEEEVAEVNVKRTDDVRQIGQWTARRYRLEGPATRDLTIDVWIADDLEVDVGTFRQLMVRLGNRPGSEWLKAYAELDGFPVLQQVELQRSGLRLRSESRVTDIEQVEPQANTYTPPQSYAQAH